MNGNCASKEILMEKIVCPVCRQKICYSHNLILCTNCNRQYPQSENTVIDLLLSDMISEDNFVLWRKHQNIYTQWFKNVWNERMGLLAKCFYDEFFNHIGKPQGLSIDIGCGYGHFKSYLKDTAYIGIDPFIQTTSDVPHGFMQRLFAYKREECLFVKGIGELLPFTDEVFDNAFVSNVLDHANDPFIVLNEARRVLKNGGKLYVIHEVPSSFTKKFSCDLNIIYSSVINKLKTYFYARSIRPAHRKIKKDELLLWLNKGFAVEYKVSSAGSHIFITARKWIK